MSESRTVSFEAAVIFEFGLGAVALLIGALVGHEVLAKVPRGVEALGDNAWACLWGLLATIPLVLGLLALERWPPSWLGDVRDTIQETLGPLLLQAGLSGRISLSLAAGVGEEMLFRGLLQDWVASWMGPIVAVAAGALAFGACHAVSKPYLVLTTIIGVFFGILYVLTGNLVAPIVCHAAYDVVAMQRLLPADEPPAENFSHLDSL